MVRLSCIVAIIGISLIYVVAEELYDDKYDDTNADTILANETVRNQYYKCFIDTAPCLTEDAKFFKGLFGEAFTTQCRKCTEKQKSMLNTLVDWYTKNEPDKWKALIAKAIENLRKKNANQ